MLKALLPLFLLFMTMAAAVAQDANGQLNQVVNGLRQGPWRIEGRSGKTDQGNYVDGKKDGEWVTTASDGVVRSRVTFTNGVPKGPATYYYPDGSVMESGYWNVDHWEGSYARFHNNGNKSCDFQYDSKGKRTGTQTYYHENGKVMFQGQWQSGKINGPLSVYNEEGRKVMERNYDADGKFQGKLDIEIPKAKQPNSSSTTQQSPAPSTTFQGSGDFTIYDSRGRKELTGTFKNGKLVTGDKYIYDANGKLIRIDKYRDGKKVGSSKPR